MIEFIYTEFIHIEGSIIGYRDFSASLKELPRSLSQPLVIPYPVVRECQSSQDTLLVGSPD